MTDPKNTICRLRWDYPVINFGRREARTCCRTPGQPIKDQEISKHGADVFLNNDYQIQRRFEMLKGVRHPDCSSCWKLEDHGASSPREREDKFVPAMIQRGLMTREQGRDFDQFARSVTIDDPILQSHNPYLLEISLGNQCDMKCMYCSYHYSTQWAVELIKHGDLRQEQYDAEFQEHDLEYEEIFWAWFNEVGKKSLRKIGIIGGEPLIVPRFYSFIDRLIESYRDMPEKKKTVTLWLVTNMNTPRAYFERFLESIPRISEFFKLEIQVSMESTGAQAEYIRNGINWNRFESNVRTLLSSDHDFGFGFQIAINALNIPHLKDFLMWAKELHDTYGRPVALKQNMVSFPDWQSPMVLTPDFADHLDEAISWLLMVSGKMMPVDDKWGKWSRYPRFLQGVANSIRKSSDNPAMRRKFYEWFSTYDRRRNLDFKATFPHHSEFWKLCEAEYQPSRKSSIRIKPT
jgi:hypothetical protein